MKINRFNTREEWLEARKGRVTGTRLKDIVVKRGTGQKIGFYEMIAEKISIPDDQNPMERGVELEEEAIFRFEKETGKTVDRDLIILTRDDNPNIAISPDGIIGDTEAVEVKCLSSARHIEAYLKQEVPSDFEMQVFQYFIVNEKLETLYFVMYDPRIPAKDFFYLTIKREDVQDKVEEYLEYQTNILEEIKRIVTDLTF